MPLNSNEYLICFVELLLYFFFFVFYILLFGGNPFLFQSYVLFLKWIKNENFRKLEISSAFDAEELLTYDFINRLDFRYGNP